MKSYKEQLEVLKTELSTLSIDDLMALYKLTDLAYPVTLRGDDGVHVHNLKANIWKEMNNRLDNYINILRK